MKPSQTESLVVPCPTCDMAAGIPCIKLGADIGKWKRVEKYFTAPHKGRLIAFVSFQDKIRRRGK